MDAWKISLALNLVVAFGYFGIFFLIFKGLKQSKQLTTNRLGAATAVIFFSCGLGHLAHADHLLAPSFGLVDPGVREGVDWHLLLIDSITAVAAIVYLTLRKSYGRLLEGPAMFSDLERDEAERKLKAAERLFRTSFDMAPIGVALVDLDGALKRVNPAFARFLGREPSELVGVRFHEVTHPEDLAADEALLAQLIAGEIPSYSMDKRYLRPDGEIVWAELHVAIVRDEDGTPLHAVAQARDITEERDAERELGRYRAVVENAEDAIYAIDLDDRIVTWNAGAERLYGWPASEAIGRTRAMIVPADRTGEMEAILAQVFAGRPVERCETVRRRRDGSLVDVQLSVSPVRDAGGVVVGASTISRDITERIAFERAQVALQQDLAQARDRFAGVLAAATQTAIIGADAIGRITTFNTGAELMLGYNAGEVVGRLNLAQLHDEAELESRARQLDVSSGFEALVALVRSGDVDTREWTFVRRDGGRLTVSLAVTAQRDPAGHLTGFLAVATDITEIRRAEERFRGAFEHAPIGVALSDADGRMAQANGALGELLATGADSLVGTPLQDIVLEEDRGRLNESLERLRTGAETVRTEHRLRHADGDDVWALLSSSLVLGAGGEPSQIITQVLDISERKHFEGRLQHLADHDALTGLHNRRRFESELARAIAHAERYGSRGAVLLLDLDGFKYVNDTLGHSVGDELIMRVGGILRGALRETDHLARLGGDEFAVILPEADEATAVEVADKLLSAVRRQGTVLTPERQARVTTSIGVTLFEGQSGLTAEDLLVEADIAMYDVKDAGRDGVKVFHSEERRRERISVRATWLERLRVGLMEDRFRLLAQPISPINSNGVPWFELLLRFEDENGDLIPPGTFLYIAERFDLINEIDRWVLGQAVRLLHTEHAAGKDLRLAVNLSGKTLSDPGLGDHLEALLREYPVPEGRLVIEVTETAAIVNIERAGVLAERLHALGCRFALDDFGAGFASFYYLKHLAFDYLKIDGEFVRHLTENATDQLVIEAVVNIARGMGTCTVAEFVGDEETLELLRRLGVDYGQGFHLGRPAPLSETVTAGRMSR